LFSSAVLKISRTNELNANNEAAKTQRNAPGLVNYEWIGCKMATIGLAKLE
jgi:hypothetical protein